jgi:hypothetical protein
MRETQNFHSKIHSVAEADRMPKVCRRAFCVGAEKTEKIALCIFSFFLALLLWLFIVGKGKKFSE